jgi:hypothetical protein
MEAIKKFKNEKGEILKIFPAIFSFLLNKNQNSIVCNK